ncbi:hypothetical protein NQ317_014110 [Molorchus minor]|uniref:Uncharacterized protein n=1 Tax=Molorchus minor TaxID=1323400 RepID=A0ABQ9IV12_9CUCU|nr:hypothetical protein NQ317_014110 [Molorchus minor]
MHLMLNARLKTRTAGIVEIWVIGATPPMYPSPAGSFAAKWGGFAAHCGTPVSFAAMCIYVLEAKSRYIGDQ